MSKIFGGVVIAMTFWLAARSHFRIGERTDNSKQAVSLSKVHPLTSAYYERKSARNDAKEALKRDRKENFQAELRWAELERGILQHGNAGKYPFNDNWIDRWQAAKVNASRYRNEVKVSFLKSELLMLEDRKDWLETQIQIKGSIDQSLSTELATVAGEVDKLKSRIDQQSTK